MQSIHTLYNVCTLYTGKERISVTCIMLRLFVVKGMKGAVHIHARRKDYYNRLSFPIINYTVAWRGMSSLIFVHVHLSN